MTSVLRTVIVDSDPESRAALRRILAGTPAAAIVGEFAALGDADLIDVKARRSDILIVEMPREASGEAAGQAAIERLAATFRDAALFVTGPRVSGDLMMPLIRAGALEYLPRPVDRADLLAAVDKVARMRRGVAPTRRVGRVISVYSPKGGLGVTTIATNLAVCLAGGRRDGVVLIDFDTRQSDVATFLGVRGSYSVLDAFENIERLDELFLRGLLVRHGSGLWVLPGPARMERFHLSADQVRAGLEIIRSHFDQIVLDLRHDLDPGTVAALEASDTVLFLTALNVSALRTGAAGLAALRHLALNLQKLRVVVVRADSGDEVTLAQAREALGVPIAWKTPSDYQGLVAAINAGQPLVTAAPRSRLSKNLTQLVQTLAAPSGEATPAPRRRATLLRWLWTPKKLAKVA